MKKKISFKEKQRRLYQGQSPTRYFDGSGGTFTMTKVKGGHRIN